MDMEPFPYGYGEENEPVSGFGFKKLSLKLFIEMIQSIGSVSGISGI